MRLASTNKNCLKSMCVKSSVKAFATQDGLSAGWLAGCMIMTDYIDPAVTCMDF